jgi:uncharacterized membrane protein YgdD (TMEM256/DUF423 family)
MNFSINKRAKFALLAGVSFALFAVILGAFGAHALKEMLDEYHLAVFETAVKYQMYHGLGLVIIGLLAAKSESKYFEYSMYLMSLGIIFFSGSLYLLAIFNLKFLGIVTPVGGVFLIMAWLSCFVGVLKS